MTPASNDQNIEIEINYSSDPIKLRYTFVDDDIKDANGKSTIVNYATEAIDGTLFTEHAWKTLPKELNDKGYELIPN